MIITFLYYAFGLINLALLAMHLGAYADANSVGADDVEKAVLIAGAVVTGINSVLLFMGAN